MLNDGEKGVLVLRDRYNYALCPHISGGFVTPADLAKIADIAQRYGSAELKITSDGRLMILDIAEEDVDKVWRELDMPVSMLYGTGVRNVQCCLGGVYCKQGMRDARAMARKLEEKFLNAELPGQFQIAVCGCPYQCSDTYVSDIGLVGMMDGWRVLAGGCGGPRPMLCEEVAKGLDDEQAVAMIGSIIEYYKTNAGRHQRLGALIEKIGADSFRETVGAHE